MQGHLALPVSSPLRFPRRAHSRLTRAHGSDDNESTISAVSFLQYELQPIRGWVDVAWVNNAQSEQNFALRKYIAYGRLATMCTTKWVVPDIALISRL